MAKNTLYLPTPVACEAIGIKRFPTKYSSNGDNGKNREAANEIGIQYKKFGTSKQLQSLQNLDVASNFNPRDIVIEVLTNRPFTTKTKTENGVTQSIYDYGDGVPEPEYKIHISPTTDGGYELDINHSHEWGASGSIFDKILKGAAELVGNVDDFITKVGNVSKGLKGQANRDAYKATPNRRIDVAETYISTEKQSIIIPFTLFTPGGEENFIKDVYGPIMTLTKISYPKRSTSLGDSDKWLSAQMGIKKESSTQATGTDANGGATKKQDDATMLDAINAINPGFRVFVADPPSYVNVYHNGGLFKYNNCYITKFSYKYKHWVDGNGNPIKAYKTGDITITDIPVSNARFAYPLVAECSLEIKTTEPLFADDFVALAEQYGKNRNTQPRS